MFQATVIGHLGANAEIKSYNGKPFVSFRVAHSERYTSGSGEQKERTQWVSCALNGDGGSLTQYLKKGQLVAVMGDCTLGLANSQIMRSMVPTCNLHVTNIELLGGAPSEDLPRQLVDADGQLINVIKFYSLSHEDFVRVNPAGHTVQLFDTRGGRYTLNADGFINRDVNAETAPAPEQTSDAQVEKEDKQKGRSTKK